MQVWDTGEILLLHVAHYLKKNAKDFIGDSGSAGYGCVPEAVLSDVSGRDRTEAGLSADADRNFAQAGGGGSFSARSEGDSADAVRMGPGGARGTCAYGASAGRAEAEDLLPDLAGTSTAIRLPARSGVRGNVSQFHSAKRERRIPGDGSRDEPAGHGGGTDADRQLTAGRADAR